MHILTWNLAFTNLKVHKSLDFVKQKNPDIICMQEVKVDGLEYLKDWDEYQLFHTLDGRNLNPDKRQYLVSLLKKEINVEIVKLIDYSGGDHNCFWDKSMRKIFNYEKTDEGMYLDISINGKKVRIFNIHLRWTTGPSYRLRQFEKVIEHMSKERENIIIGDFNIFGKWYYSIFGNLLFNYEKADWLMDEREVFEKIFIKNNLVNIFGGENTWPWIGLKFQLDHILFSPRLKYRDKNVPNNKVGSDHRMIEVKINL